MYQQHDITVRRARVRDADRIAAFVNQHRRNEHKISEQSVIARFGTVGFLLAERGDDLVGLLGWQAENLVVRVTDFLVWPAAERLTVGQALLSEMERTAHELQCEVVLLFLPSQRSPHLAEFCEAFGYAPKIVSNLTKAWQEAAHDARFGDDETVLMKPLRSDRVLRPI